jgi:hypothetical protein
MDITEDEAALLLDELSEKLNAAGARDVLEGIDESRRIGIEEPVGHAHFLDATIRISELRSLGTVRRRPLTSVEALQMALQRVHQRLNVIPAIAQRLEKALDTRDIEWRVDESFVPSGGAQRLTTTLTELMPDGVSDIVVAYGKIWTLIPNIAPDPEPATKDG